MSTIKSSTEHLTLNADGSGKDIKFQANGVEKASISSTGAFTSTSIDATKLSGALPAIDGSALTGVGKMLQVKEFKSTAGTNYVINADSGSAPVMDSFSITIQEDSRVILNYQTAQYIKSTPTPNPQIILVIDGVAQATNTEHTPDTNHNWYGANTYRETQTGYMITPPLSAGTHTLGFLVGRYNSGTITMNYQGRLNRYLLTEVSA